MTEPTTTVMPPFGGGYGYDAFDNMTTRSGNYALNPTQSDSATYTNNRRAGWTYNAQGKVTNSSDSSDSGGSSTRAWTYDAVGSLTFNSEVRNGQTTTLATGYDGDGKVNHEIINNTTGDYLIHSSVLGTRLTKLKANGTKDITYVPANGLISPMQMQDQPFSTPASYLTWVSRDPLGIQENEKAYDPFGNLVANVQPPSGGPPGYTPVYGPPYGWLTQSSFTNANNFSGGCYSAQNNNPAACSDVAQEIGSRLGPEFWSNLPGAHNDNEYAQGIYNSHVDDIFRGWDHWQDGAWYWGWSQNDDKRPPRFRLNHAAKPQERPLSGEHLKVFEEAYNLAWSRLASACADEITGDSSRMLGQYGRFVLHQISNAKNFRAGGPGPITSNGGPAIASTHDPGDQGKAVIKIYDEFFNPSYLENRALAAGATTKDSPVYQSAGIPRISSTTVMAIVILHELRHAITGKTHRGETDQQRNAWDARIFKACFPELQIKPKPSK